MFPAVFLALPLLLPITNHDVTGRVDLTVPQTLLTQPPLLQASVDRRVSGQPQPKGPLLPPLYRREDGAVSLSLSPGAPCTAACIKLAGTF